MGDNSTIEWTDATWNPTTGCNKVSPGCKHCYAERLSRRLQAMGNPKYKNGFKFTVHRDALDLPLSWARPRKIFVNSMSDLFHEQMPESYLDECFAVMEKANWHVFQVLTKRPKKMVQYSRRRGNIPANVWLGTSVELASFKYRLDLLREVPAKVRFVSFEPLLGPLGRLNLDGISWAIVGGESGPNHRPIDPKWVREIRDQCLSAGVAFFFKQWGGPHPTSGGRELDDRFWDEFPPEIVQFTENHRNDSTALRVRQ
jgi:protein gp37